MTSWVSQSVAEWKVDDRTLCLVSSPVFAMCVQRRYERSNIQEESHQDIWMSALWWSHSHLHLPHPGFKQPHRATGHTLLLDPDGMLCPESQLLSLVTSFWELTLHALVSFIVSYSLACPPWPPPVLRLQPPRCHANKYFLKYFFINILRNRN